MINKKLLLYIGLGVIIFSLWELWQKDYGHLNTPIIDNINTTIKLTNANHIKDLVSTPTAIYNSMENNSVVNNRIIKMHTDLFDIIIDTVGGNIIQADLIKYRSVFGGSDPIRVLSNDQERFYITESSLISAYGPDLPGKSARYVSEKNEYWLNNAPNLKVKLLWKNSNNIKIVKIFTFYKGRYDIAVDYEVNNKSLHTWYGNFIAEIKRKKFDTTKNWFKINTYTGAAISSTEKPYEKISFTDIDNHSKKKKEIIRESIGGWIAMQQRYFLSLWIPVQNRVHKFYNTINNEVYTIGLCEHSLEVKAGESKIFNSILYIGPQITDNFAHFAKGLDRTSDYGDFLWFLCVGFFWLLKQLYSLVGNWGLSIILITVLIKIVFYKFSESSSRSMLKMKKLMPKLNALKEMYKDDNIKLNQATIELYKKEKINPLNFGGCLPMLIQIPFFIALYYVLIGAVELRHAKFMFWINDLSSADPYYILPILMGMSMWLQQKMNNSISAIDPVQTKIMLFIPIVFTLFFLNFPSGLVLYWLVSNILSILQQWYINKKLSREDNF